MYSAAPWSMSHVRPCQSEQVRVAGGPVGLVVNESNHTTAAAASGSTSGDAPGIERQGAGQEVEPEVEAATAMDEILELLVGFRIAEAAVDLDRDDLGDGQPEGATDLAGEPLRDERPRTLAGAPELHDVQPVVVGLDQARQRAALAQGRDVAGGGHVAGLGHRAGV